MNSTGFYPVCFMIHLVSVNREIVIFCRIDCGEEHVWGRASDKIHYMKYIFKIQRKK